MPKSYQKSENKHTTPTFIRYTFGKMPAQTAIQTPPIRVWASAQEKLFAQAVKNVHTPDAIISAKRAHSLQEGYSTHFLIAYCHLINQDYKSAHEHVHSLTQPDKLANKYLQTTWNLPVSQNVYATAYIGSEFVALMQALVASPEKLTDFLISQYQRQTHTSLLLARVEHAIARRDYHAIVDMTTHVSNTSDCDLAIMIHKAEALVQLGIPEGALIVLQNALRVKNRDEELMRQARYERGCILLNMGRKVSGRRDLATIYAECPKYRNVAKLLDAK